MQHLFISISENSMRASILHNGETLAVHEITFSDKKDYRYKEQIDAFFMDKGIKDLHFEECIVSWFSPKTTLVPANVFNESSPEILFRLCFGDSVPSSHIDYNRLPEHQIVSIYEIPLWVKSYFVLRYPRSIIQHESTHLVRGLLNGNAFKPFTALTIHEQHITCAIVKHNKLQFFSNFDYKESTDIVYHLLFVLQQKELTKEKGTILLSRSSGANPTVLTDLQDLISKVGDFQSHVVETNESLITSYQLLCV